MQQLQAPVGANHRYSRQQRQDRADAPEQIQITAKTCDNLYSNQTPLAQKPSRLPIDKVRQLLHGPHPQLRTRTGSMLLEDLHKQDPLTRHNWSHSFKSSTRPMSLLDDSSSLSCSTLLQSLQFPPCFLPLLPVTVEPQMSYPPTSGLQCIWGE
jgi:hypothetical protein